MDDTDSLLEGPEWDALVAAVCCAADAETIVEDEALRLAA